MDDTEQHMATYSLVHLAHEWKKPTGSDWQQLGIEIITRKTICLPRSGEQHEKKPVHSLRNTRSINVSHYHICWSSSENV